MSYYQRCLYCCRPCTYCQPIDIPLSPRQRLFDSSDDSDNGFGPFSPSGNKNIQSNSTLALHLPTPLYQTQTSPLSNHSDRNVSLQQHQGKLPVSAFPQAAQEETKENSPVNTVPAKSQVRIPRTSLLRHNAKPINSGGIKPLRF